MRHRRLWKVIAGIILGLLAGQPAVTAQEVQLRIREAALDSDGFVRLVVSVSADADPDAFVVTENGRRIEAVDVASLADSGARSVAVVLALDLSGSMRGEPLEQAKTAATAFVEALPEQVDVALVGFGPSPRTLAGFTGDRDALRAAISEAQAAGETALHDAIVHSAGLLSETDAQRNLVVFSDGGDTVSRASFEDAVAAARDAKAPVTTVGLRSPELDAAALTDLAQRSGARSFDAAAPAELASAFARAAGDIARQSVLTYSAPERGPDELPLAVSAQIGDAVATDEIVVLNTRTNPALGTVVEVGGMARSGAGLGIGLALSIAAIALLVLVMAGTRSGHGRVLGRVVDFYSSGGTEAQEPTGSALRRLAVRIADRIPKPDGYEAALQARLEGAAWPLRAGEFLALRAASALAAFAVGSTASGTAWFGLLAAAVAWFAFNLVVDHRAGRRQAAFAEQLPDTLQLLAASLEAGYGVMQGLDTIVRESSPPTSEEFARALAEVRLGVPVHDALEALADRLGGDDLRWVVMAMDIQREVGGNLASLLRTVAATLREREQLRRSVRVLSAEGRLSAVILAVLPFGLAAYISVVNPEYVGQLISTGLGRLMVIAALSLMAAGGLWLKRVVHLKI